MEMPNWLKTSAGDRPLLIKGSSSGFIGKTLHHIVSFVEDSVFNENISRENGLLQKIEPRLKLITLVILIIVLNFQVSVDGIAVFFFIGLLISFLSKVPPHFVLKRLLPAAVFTLFVAVPATLNLVLDGEPLLVLYRFGRQVNVGPVVMPSEIAITRQGLTSAITLFLRVVTSVSFVFLMTMTTRPNVYIESLSSLVPGALGPVVSVGYRYMFFFVRKVEQFIMGFKSRSISSARPFHGQRWVASRIGLLFSISMKLSEELTMAMESRGYKVSAARSQKSAVRIKDLSKTDIVWFVSMMLFAGVMLWKSLV